jgi:glycosyltransferase involved in cell wall biosynthesis
VVAANGDQEGTPVVLAEAVALGVPVVASRLGGIADQLDDGTGWLVPPGDASALAVALSEAMNSPHERDVRATRARKLVSPALTLDGTAEAYARIYREMIHGR